jgi:hypothetical protein
VYGAGNLSPDRPVILYVRLASRPSASAAQAERSAVAEWLAGQTPTPQLPRRGIAIGEMPTYGAGGIATRGPGAQTQSLQLLELERERAREKREAQERARKAALEGEQTTRASRPLLPFEDFDLQARATLAADGTPVLRRSLTVGPGEYDLTVAWLDAGARPGTAPHVARRSLSMAPASTARLTLSSVIIADEVSVRETPVPSTNQTAHPYSIGATDIVPARDHVLTPDERLALVVQVINASASAAGKPDIAMAFAVFRREGNREQAVGTLAPQVYNELTMPFDFDLRKGHPVFAAVAVPLQTFKRGEYRLEVRATDRLAATSATTEVGFTVIATPATLLREAPSLTPPFDPKEAAVPAAVPLMLGAVRASEGHDREAIAAWQNAMRDGAAPASVLPLLIDAHLRLGDTPQAIELANQALTTADDARVTRQLARARLIRGEHAEAFDLLDRHLQRTPDDVDAHWLALHALYASFVAGAEPGAGAAGRRRIGELAERYAALQGRHAALARDWANAIR